MLMSLLVLAAAFQVGIPAPAPPQQVTVRNEVTVQVPEPDPEAVAEMAGQSFQGIVVTVLAPTLAKWANTLLDIPDIYRTTPPDLTYDNPAVRSMAQLVRNAALGLFALVVFGWGVAKWLGHEPPYGRPILGVVLAFGNLVWWEIGIRLNNAVCAAIGAPEVTSLVRPHLSVPTLTTDPAQAFGPSLLVIAYAIVLLLLFGSMVFRLGFLDILIVTGSLALMCKGAEQTDRFTETYVGLSTGTLFSQIMVTIALALAPVLGLGTSGIASSVLGLVVLLLARRMPGLLSNRFSQGGGGGIRLGGLVVLRRLLMRV